MVLVQAIQTAQGPKRRSTVLMTAAALALALAGCNSEVYSNLDASAGKPVAVDGASTAGNVPPDNEKIHIAKKQFRERNYGLAEKTFRGIIESQPRNAEAWLGLAASYDQLRRFKLADRAYGQVVKLDGPSVALYNNRGYSYLLRGDRRRARREFSKARGLEPGNQFVQNNLRILDKR
jgi:Flp pilus assembly protein TadD